MGSILPALGAFDRALMIPQHVWERAGEQTLGRDDPFKVELTERVNGQVRGPISLRLTIARADLKGSIYYNTCVSLSGLAAQNATTGLGVFYSRMMRIPAGRNAELLLTTDDCQGCHSVSANGSRLITQRMPPIEDWLMPNQTGVGMSYPLTPEGTVGSMTGLTIGPDASYGALYPDGSKYLSMATPGSLFSEFDFGRRFAGTASSVDPIAGAPATLRDATTGRIVPDTGIPAGVLMPMFSPDGTRLVFNDLELEGGRGLAVMEYDVQRDKASGYTVLVREDGATGVRPGWPFFLPDNRAVVFVRAAGQEGWIR